MVSTKYTKDYRLDNVLDRSGKLVTKAVYCGDWYGFAGSEATVRRAKRLLPSLSVLMAVLFAVGVLLPGETPVYHGSFFVSFPFALAIVPIWLLLASSWRLLWAKERFERFYSDKLGRFTGASVAAIVLLGISLVLHVLHWILEGERSWDFALLGATVLMLAMAIVILLNANLAATVVVGKADYVLPAEADQPIFASQSDENIKQKRRKRK